MKTVIIAFALWVVLFFLQAAHYFQFQTEIQKFAAKGPRFTANDGQALCLRVQALEKNPQPCRYGEPR